MTRLYGRRVSLVLANKEGQGLDLSDFRIKFRVRQFEAQTPNTADIYISNITAETAAKFSKEFTRVVLQAGYPGRFGTVFDGTVVQVRRGRTSPTDTYTALTAFDGDVAHNYAVVNKTLASGATPEEVLKAIRASMGEHGVTEGHTDKLEGPALPRGRVLYGMARDHMRDLALQTDTVWNISNGKLQVVAKTGYLPGEAVELNADTGLIGLPQQTQDGIVVRCLLDPLLRVQGRIKINNAAIQEARLNVNYQGVDKKQEGFMPKKDRDGIYRVLVLDHTGDSRGTEFYSDIVCLSIEPGTPVPPSLIQRLAPPEDKPAITVAPATNPVAPVAGNTTSAGQG